MFKNRRGSLWQITLRSHEIIYKSAIKNISSEDLISPIGSVTASLNLCNSNLILETAVTWQQSGWQLCGTEKLEKCNWWQWVPPTTGVHVLSTMFQKLTLTAQLTNTWEQLSASRLVSLLFNGFLENLTKGDATSAAAPSPAWHPDRKGSEPFKAAKKTFPFDNGFVYISCIYR